jgi:hypothetical protein
MPAARFLVLLSLFCLAPALAAAEDRPAVDGITGKATLESGLNYNELQDNYTTAFSFDGKVTTTLGRIFDSDTGRNIAVEARVRHNVIVDEGYERSTILGFTSINWQHPDYGALGPDFTYGSAGGDEYYQIGLRGTAYLGPFNVSGIVRYLDGELYYSEGVFLRAAATVYVTENISAGAGFNYTDYDDGRYVQSLTWRAEWLAFPDAPIGVSLLARGNYRFDRYGDDNFAVVGGVSFYFSERAKTLVRRQREDNL